MLKKTILVITLLTLVLSIPASAAEAPYKSYVYDNKEAVLPTQIGYVPTKEVSGADLGVGNFKNPQDFFVDRKNDLLYVCDTENERILVFDKSLKHVRTVDSIQTETLPDGLNGVSGIHVDDEGTMYLAQRGGNNVVIVDKDGMLVNYINRPNSELFPEGNMFEPKRVLCDKAGRILVLVRGVYQGAAVFNRDAEFLGFYGGNRVAQTADVLTNFIWRRFMTKEQIKNTMKVVPTEYDSFCVSGDFIYTVSQTDVTPDERIKKLNPAGIDVMNTDAQFGDLESYTVNGTTVDTTFNDIAVDEAGNMYALDLTRGRIFQYDAEGNLLFTYGGVGAQTGTFRQPVAIETWGDSVLVLDQMKGTITFFGRTEFGQAVVEAVELYNDGLYEEAEEYWREVLKFDSNYQLAYDGIGKSMYNRAMYKEACDYFKVSDNTEWYSKAYKELRTINMRRAFPYVIVGAAAAAAAFAAFKLVKRRKRKCKN